MNFKSATDFDAWLRRGDGEREKAESVLVGTSLLNSRLNQRAGMEEMGLKAAIGSSPSALPVEP